MRSRAHFKTHPLHPMLIPFPIAFFTGTFLFDVIGLVRGDEMFWNIGYYLTIAGISFALLAAIPGIIDYLHTVPPQSSAKKRATKHGLINTVVVIIFTVAWFYRQNNEPSSFIILALELIGVVLLTIAGWMGGTMVYRNQIGVDQRYAHAGKWKEVYIEEANEPVLVGNSDELKINQMKLLHLREQRIVLARTESGYVAFDDRCPHKGGSMAGGSMMCGTVQCPWHGSQFDVHNGKVTAGPAKEGISVYPIIEKEGKIYLNVQGSDI